MIGFKGSYAYYYSSRCHSKAASKCPLPAIPEMRCSPYHYFRRAPEIRDIGVRWEREGDYEMDIFFTGGRWGISMVRVAVIPPLLPSLTLRWLELLWRGMGLAN